MNLNLNRYVIKYQIAGNDLIKHANMSAKDKEEAITILARVHMVSVNKLVIISIIDADPWKINHYK